MKFDAIIIGGGPAGCTVATKLQKSGLKCILISEGHSIHDVNLADYFAAGGEILAGDRVERGVLEGGSVSYVVTEKLADEKLEAKYYVLATGKFFGKGIVADMDSVYEPVFGLDVAYEADRTKWFDADFAAEQPFLQFGVKAGADAHPFVGGAPVANLYVCGEVVEGCSCAASADTAAVVAQAEAVAALIA